MSSEEFMMTAEELRLKRRKRRLLLLLVIATAIVFVLGFFSARPALNAIKAWQARRHANKAFALIAEEKWTDARKEAVAAYQLRATEPQALRAVARYLSRTRQADALEFWQQLEKVAPLTREDRQDEAAIAIMAGETSRAEIAVQALLESKGSDPAGWLLAAQLSIQKGVPEDAKKSLEKIFNDPNATEREQFQAALLQLATSQNADDANAGWARVENLSRGQSATALDALVTLARRALSNQKSEDRDQKSEVRELATRLESHSLAKAPQKLLALDLVEHVDPTQRETLIARAIARWKDADADSLTALAVWLNGKGEYQLELDTIPLEKALLSRELFLQHLDALGALGRWSEIKQLLDSERFPLDPVVQRMYLARCNAQLGEKTAAENNWKRALETAGGDVGKLISLGDYAEKNGILDVAESAFNAAAVEAPKLRVAQQGRLRAAQRSGDTKKIHAVLADMLKLWPNDAAVQNDEGYTRLLLLSNNAAQKDEGRGMKDEVGDPPSQSYGVAGQELITIERLAADLIKRNPASLPHRTLLALARLRQKRAADALAVYENIQVSPNALTPSALAVHAAVLAANGKMDEAKTEAKQIKIDNLLPEEKALIADIF